MKEKTWTTFAVIVLMICAFIIGYRYHQWKTTDRYSTYSGAKTGCEKVIRQDRYVRDHTEVDRGLLLDDCIKYVMNQGAN